MSSLADLLRGGNVQLGGKSEEDTRPSKAAQLLRSVARGAPQAVTGLVDLAALPLTATGMIDSKNVFGSTDYLTKKGLLPPAQPGLANQTVEVLSGGLMPLSPAAMRQTIEGVKSLGPKAYDAAEKYMTKTGGMAWAHQPHTPQKPNPMVGKTFETEHLGNLIEKKPVKFEDLKGSSALVMPWDSTSRNVKVKSISGVELPNPIVTHGGQDYARDVTHQAQGIAGASNLGIAKRIRDRDAMARIENEQMGGTGQIIHLPTTMGDMSENFSVMPTQALMELVKAREPSKAFYKQMNNAIRNVSPDGKPASFKPFKGFAGLDNDEGLIQIMSGEGIDSTAGELRKAIVKVLSKKSQGFDGGSTQKYLDYNHEDLVAAINDPSLKDVPKGYVGNTVIGVGPEGMRLTPSQNPTYNTDFSGQYLGTLGENVPYEAVFPKVTKRMIDKYGHKGGTLRNNVLGAMEKSKNEVSEFIDDEAIDNYYKYLLERKKQLERGN